MWIERHILNSRVIRGTDDERRFVREYLAFPDPTAHHRRSSRKQIQMYNILTDAFPSGFVPMVVDAAREEGMQVEIVDKRVRPPGFDPNADLAWLRDYQDGAVRTVVKHDVGILWEPTGAGKTELAVGCVRVWGCKTLFVVHRSTLMDQAARRYEQRALDGSMFTAAEEAMHRLTGKMVGRIGEGEWSVGDRFTCATFQTIAAALKRGDQRAFNLLNEVEAVIVDECHVLPADSFWSVVHNLQRAYYRVGLSGTPLARGDRRSMLAIATLGPIIHRTRTSELIDGGVLAKPHIRMVEVPQRSDARTWAAVYREAIVGSAHRNKVVVQAALKAEKPAFVFVKEVKHGKAIERALWNAGLRAAFVWGTHNTEQRQRQVRDLVAGRLDVIVCSVVFQEGMDVPELRSVVVASGGKSVIATLQRIGRGMRVEKDAAGNVIKNTFEVFDIADTGCGCREAAKLMGHEGFGIHPGCKWLEHHTKERRDAYLGEGHTTTIEKWP